jgi:hypothetical protein
MRSTLARAGQVVTGRNVENIAGMLRHLSVDADLFQRMIAAM